MEGMKFTFRFPGLHPEQGGQLSPVFWKDTERAVLMECVGPGFLPVEVLEHDSSHPGAWGMSPAEVSPIPDRQAVLLWNRCAS